VAKQSDNTDSFDSSKALDEIVETTNPDQTEFEDFEIDINVYSYAPKVFRFIRAIDNISEFDIMTSVKPL
jgi:hypothetical protein